MDKRITGRLACMTAALYVVGFAHISADRSFEAMLVYGAAVTCHHASSSCANHVDDEISSSRHTVIDGLGMACRPGVLRFCPQFAPLSAPRKFIVGTTPPFRLVFGPFFDPLIKANALGQRRYNIRLRIFPGG